MGDAGLAGVNVGDLWALPSQLGLSLDMYVAARRPSASFRRPSSAIVAKDGIP